MIAAIKALRPKQWSKNVLLFAALLFSFRFLDSASVVRTLIGFLSFSFISSAGYVFNDIRDREADANHPTKRLRPIASGALPVPAAWALMALVCLAGFAVALWLSPAFALIALLYLASTLSYSVYFKHYVIIDIMMLSVGFLWRAVAGAVVLGVLISPWLLVCTGFFSLFLGFNKRRGELDLLKDGADAHRRNLAEYSPALLDEFQAITTSGTVISYALYCVLAAPTPWLLLTLPYVLYVIFRYIYLVQQKAEGGDPTSTLFKDIPILVCAVLYAVTTVVALLVAGRSP